MNVKKNSVCYLYSCVKDGPSSTLGGTSLTPWVTNQFPIVFKWIKRPEREAHQLLQHISEIQNVWSTCRSPSQFALKQLNILLSFLKTYVSAAFYTVRIPDNIRLNTLTVATKAQ